MLLRSEVLNYIYERGRARAESRRRLAHVPKDKIRAAYNRAQYLTERKKMMQAWADYLDTLKAGGNVVAIKRKAS